MIIEGAIAVKASLEGRKRKVNKVIIDKTKKDKNTNYIKYLARENQVEILLMDRKEIDNLANKKTHGGILADVEKRFMIDLRDLALEKNTFMAVLEGIEDPYNYASSVRSLYASGCNCIIVGSRNWSSAMNIIIKGSAGASEFLDIVEVPSIKEALDYLKLNDFAIYAAIRGKNSLAYTQADFNKKLVLAIGGEMRGLSKSVKESYTQAIYIPYANNFRNSLGAAASSAVLGFEIMRQRSLEK